VQEVQLRRLYERIESSKFFRSYFDPHEADISEGDLKHDFIGRFGTQELSKIKDLTPDSRQFLFDSKIGSNLGRGQSRVGK